MKISKKTAIIIPIKKYKKSKTRLSPFLSFEERKCLTQILILDTLEKVHQLNNSQTIVVSSETLQLPDKFNDIIIINEDFSNGVNNAIELANKFIENILIIIILNQLFFLSICLCSLLKIYRK